MLRPFRYRISLWLISVLALMGWNGERALAAPSLRVFCDSAAWIGDSLSLKLQYEGTDPRHVMFPILDPQGYPGLEFFSATPTYDTSYDKTTGLFRLRANYPFAIYTAGTYAIPPVSFRVFEDGQILIYDTDTLWVNIYEPDVDFEQDIRDIKPIQQVSVWERMADYIRRHYIWISAILLGLLAAVFGWYYWRRRRRNLPAFSAPKPVVPPVDRALANLKTLKDKQLWQKNRVKEYYTELTEILRVFLADEYRIAAIEMTSDECIENLRRHYPDRKDDIARLETVFHTADLVKFAKGEPQPSEHEDCFRTVWQFVAQHKTSTHEPE
ncbi:hypothetical protein HDR64_02660 [bacterium]|nr:hypothetical protein [bacterium]